MLKRTDDVAISVRRGRWLLHTTDGCDDGVAHYSSSLREKERKERLLTWPRRETVAASVVVAAKATADDSFLFFFFFSFFQDLTDQAKRANDNNQGEGYTHTLTLSTQQSRDWLLTKRRASRRRRTKPR